MPQTATTEKPEMATTAFKRVGEAILATDATTYNPDDRTYCKHYVVAGTVTSEWLQKQITLWAQSIKRKDELVALLRAEGASPDPVKVDEYDDVAMKVRILNDLVMADLRATFPDLKKAMEGVSIDRAWVVRYGDHSSVEDDDDVPDGVENILESIFGRGSVRVVFAGGGRGKDKPPLQ